MHPGEPFLIAYSRISDDWRKHNKKKAATSSWAAGKGVANQHRRNDRNAARHGAVIVHRYTDNDLSAAKRDVVRPDFQAMLRDLRRGLTPEGYPVHGIIVVDQDRAQRTDRDWEDLVEALTLVPSRRFYTPSGPMDLTDEAEILKTGVMAVVNKVESLKKKRRIRDWHQDRILDGLPHSGPRPFGWKEDRETLEPEEAEYLGWSIDERIKGKSMTTLCAEAKKRELTGSLGGEIVPTTLTQMMTAPRVCGYRANRGELVLDDDGSPIVGVWETVTTPEKWRAVCATFGDGSTYLARGSGTRSITGIPKTVKYLGSSLLRCQYRIPEEKSDGTVTTRVCNARIAGVRASSKRSPYVYSCSKCSHNAISGPMVDKLLERLVLTKLKQAEATYIKPEMSWPKESQLRQKADKLAGLEAQWSSDEISDAMFYRLAPSLEKEVRKLQRERAQFELAAESKQEAPNEVARKWLSGEYDLSQKRQVLFEMFAAVQVLPGQRGNKTPNPKRLIPVWN
ncbi:hypothetical protein BG452_06350 [Streptomyces sp. CBMA123]|nr:hypothetical protein [Streptomyces sp. CBMA123]